MIFRRAGKNATQNEEQRTKPETDVLNNKEEPKILLSRTFCWALLITVNLYLKNWSVEWSIASKRCSIFFKRSNGMILLNEVKAKPK